MSTIIDSLIVRLGLSSQSMSGQVTTATKQLATVEKQADKTSASVAGIGKQLAAFFALLGGTVALKRFIEDTVDANAALARFSRNLGIDIGTVAAWGNTVELAGGTASGLQGTLDMLSKAQTQFRVTGESSLVPYFSTLGLNFAQFALHGQDVTQTLTDIQAASEHIANRTERFNFLRMMGIDEGTANAMMQSRKELQLTIAKQKEFADNTRRFGPNAERMQRGFIGLKQEAKSFGLELLDKASPAILKMLEVLGKLSDWAVENKEFLKDVGIILGTIATGLGAIAIAASPITLTTLAVTALAAGIALLWQDYQTWKRGGDSLIDWEKWRPGIEFAQAAIDLLIKSLGKLEDAYKSYYERTTGRKFTLKGLIEDTKFVLGFDNAYTPDPGKPGQGQASGPKYMQQYFQDRGWSKEQAAGIAANIISESNGKTNAIGDSGSAYGLAQWHSDRQRKFKEFAGKDIRTSSLDDQLSFIQHELTQGEYKSAGDRLRKAGNAADAGSIVSKYYERPLHVEADAASRGKLAAEYAGVSPVANGGVDKSVTVKVDNITVQTQATDAKGIAGELGNAITEYWKVAQANGGLR